MTRQPLANVWGVLPQAEEGVAEETVLSEGRDPHHLSCHSECTKHTHMHTASLTQSYELANPSAATDQRENIM